MSTFLGPIHYWLYNKIQLQEGLTEEILKPHKELYSKLDSLCGKAERRPLEEAIDTGNIHGWLQEQITIVEGRFAAAVTWVLENENTDLERLTAIARDFGKKHPITATSAPEVFKALQDLLLDGMPCDHVNQVLEQNETQVIWKQTIDLHRPHWEKAGGDVSNYYTLREALVSRMLQESGFVFCQEENCFYIRK